MDYKKTLVTLTIGTFMMVSTFTVSASAGEQEANKPTSGAALQAPPTDEQGGYTHRNTWNHRYVKKNQYGYMEEIAGSAKKRGFVDEDGDGINDLAPDHDGDGIPNCQDSDWIKEKKDGTGYKHGNQGTDGGKQCNRLQKKAGTKGRR